MRVVSRVRSVRRRVRCMRKGHYWLQRMDTHAHVEVFCRRCGRIAPHGAGDLRVGHSGI
jgi:hypothetical protein